MSELLDGVNVLNTLLVSVAVFSLAPHAVLNLVVMLYPKSHPRRAELRAEVHAVPRWQKPFWVAEQLCTVAVEAVPLRFSALVRRLSRRSLRPEAARLQALMKEVLSTKQRDVLVYRVGLGYDAEQTAIEMNMSVAAVRLLQHRALQKLRTTIEERGYANPDSSGDPLA